MQAYYYTSPVEDLHVALIITEKSPQQLVQENVFKEDTKYIQVEYSGVSDPNFIFVDMIKFDDPENPTKIVPWFEKLNEKYLEEIRLQRANKFAVLDAIAVRAISQNRTDILALVEADKQALRDLPENIDTSNFTEVKEFVTLFPVILNVNYYSKYNDIFNGQ